MPPLNFSYGFEQPKAIAGAIADMRLNEMISPINEDETLTGFGVPVFRGETDGTATKTASATPGAFLGITAIDRGAYTDYMLTEEGFRHLDNMLVLERGPIWVEVAVAVEAGQTVRVATATGAFTNVEAGSAAIPAIFDTSTTGPGLAKVRVR